MVRHSHQNATGSHSTAGRPATGIHVMQAATTQMGAV